MDKQDSNVETTTATPPCMLTDEQYAAIAHATGHRSAGGCSTNGGRNFYCTDEDNPVWVPLREKGYANRHNRDWMSGGGGFTVTPEGRAALAHDCALREAGPS